MLKKHVFIFLFLLCAVLVMTYQNCAQSEQSNLFGSYCNGEKCYADPDALALELDMQLVPGGVFKISSNPPTGINNLRLTGRCESAGFQKALVKAKIYQCIGSSESCSVLKSVSLAACTPGGTFEIGASITNLTPGNHQLQMEIVGIDEFEQEVYGRYSKAEPILTQVQQTIKPPVLASFSGTNFWAQDKIYYFATSTEKVVLDGYITGFCDYNASVASANNIQVKLSIKGSSTYTLLNSTQCKKIVSGSVQASSPNRGGRSGYFELDAFSIFMTYSGGSFVTCQSNDYNCLNNSLNRMTNRLVALALFQKDVSFNYDVFSVRKLILHYKSERAGKGWLSEVLTETLRRIKRSFNFSNGSVSGDLDGTQSGTNDFTQASRILTSVDEFYDPLITSGESRYGFGTRAFIVRWLLGATEDISASSYTNSDIYFLGASNTIPYRNIALAHGCSLTNISDPIKSVTGSAYSPDVGVERIALCLAHRYINGLWNKSYADTVRMVQEGVTFANNNQNCFYGKGGTISNQDCAIILDFLQATTKMKNRHLAGTPFGNANDTQLKYFGNGLTQFYINKIMINLNYRNSSGENSIFASIFLAVYPELTDVALRRKLYPTEYNYVGATKRFSGTRTKQFPTGSYIH